MPYNNAQFGGSTGGAHKFVKHNSLLHSGQCYFIKRVRIHISVLKRLFKLVWYFTVCEFEFGEPLQGFYPSV